MSKSIYFFFDDSGVLHRNEPSGYFVYAGYVFSDKKSLEVAKRKYINTNKKIKKANKIKGELKAAGISTKHKRALFNSICKSDSLSIVVRIDKVYDSILNDKKSICRYKDYLLKMLIKRKLQQMIEQGILSSTDDVCLFVNIDAQLTASNGYYSLKDLIREELQHGIVNFYYGRKFSPVFSGNVTVHIKYCDSSRDYLIQASDILANRIWTSYRTGNEKLRKISSHLGLTAP